MTFFAYRPFILATGAWQQSMSTKSAECSLVTSIRFLVENEINLYKIGTTTEGWQCNDNGSLTVFISKDRPIDAKRLANWLSASYGSFMLFIRLYYPLDSVARGDFELPQLNRVEP